MPRAGRFVKPSRRCGLSHPQPMRGLVEIVTKLSLEARWFLRDGVLDSPLLTLTIDPLRRILMKIVKKPKPIKDAAQLTPEKGGFVIYGRNARGELCVLTSLVQGRFSVDPHDRTKYYGLAKGSLDVILQQSRDGGAPIVLSETGLDGALRETKEETGLDIAALFGAQNLVRYKAGQVLQAVPSPLDDRVRIAHASVKDCADYAYISGAGVQRRLQLYYIEVDGIEHLADHLKLLDGALHAPGQSMAQRGIADICAQKGYPNFDAMMHILRTGKVTANDTCWAPADYTLFEHPVFPAIEARLKKEGRQRGVRALNADTPQNWIEFCEKIPGADFKKLKPQFAIIKKYFEDLGLAGDDMSIKLDDKDCPLCFYQEAGEIVPLKTLVMRSLRSAEQNPKYAQAIWGTYNGSRIEKRYGAHAQFPHAQISGFARLFDRIGDAYGVSDTLLEVAQQWSHGKANRTPVTQARAESFADYIATRGDRASPTRG